MPAGVAKLDVGTGPSDSCPQETRSVPRGRGRDGGGGSQVDATSTWA